jgi:hypothetical protein
MSLRDTFWFLAGALVTVAIMVTMRAWLRERPAQNERTSIPRFAVPIAAALALIGVALGIYFLTGSPDSIAAPGHASSERLAGASQSQPMGQAAAGSLDDVTSKLAARLAANGGTDNDWKLLAQSYEYMGRSAEAKLAEKHVVSAVPQSGPQGGAGEDSTSGGIELAAIADALDTPSGTASQSGGNIQTSGNAQISGTVDIASKLVPQAQSGATLFIYAKQPDTPGPPLAVLRVRADHWPVSFTLTDDNAMVPGRNLSNANNVQIEARISLNGDALPQSGDLVGSVTSVNPRAGQLVRISIDRKIG